MTPRTSKKTLSEPLVGRFFHSIENGKVVWQGTVIGRVSEEVYLVQLFEWLMGEPSDQRLVGVNEMTQWLFYSSQDEMTYSYEHGTASKKRAKVK
ncbi:MAG: hypothetical protein NTZ46_01805 [Verrucomicrobia bacterium]|nr:hypothetical protein [Verrucomicrobiota bacterium]